MTEQLISDNNSLAINIIGKVSSPYGEKFAIPRQPGLVDAAKGTITLINEANNLDLLRGIEQFSHIWVIFIFHGTQAQGWKPLVRPPRLGGNVKLGVLASRSTFRPNPIGMSVVKLDRVSTVQGNVVLSISGLDLLDGTPVIDIKPYIPYSDAIIDAQAGFAQTAPSTELTIHFCETAMHDLVSYQQACPDLRQLIEQVLAQDPRPAYKRQKPDEKIYGMKLEQYSIKWHMTSLADIEVIRILPQEPLAKNRHPHAGLAVR